MKFSVIAGVATLMAGAIAAPRQNVAVAKRTVDLGSAIAAVQKEVTDTIALANSISQQVVAAANSDANQIVNITAGVLNLNATLDNVVQLLNGLGLSQPAEVVKTEGQKAVNTANSVVGVAANLAHGIVAEANNILSGTPQGAADGSTALAVAAGDILTQAASLGEASSLTSVVGQLLTTISDLLNNITSSVSAGNLGDVSGASESTDTLNKALQNLLTAVTTTLSNLLGGL